MWHLTVLSSLMVTGCCVGEQDTPQRTTNGGSNSHLDELVLRVFGTDAWGTDPEIREHLATPTPKPGSLKDLANNFFSTDKKPIGQASQIEKNDSGIVVVNDNDSDDSRSSEGCICIPYYQCRNGTIFEDGAGLIDAKSSLTYQPGRASRRFARDLGQCGNYLEVCCKPPKIVRAKELDVCGRRNPDGVGLRAVDEESKNAKFGEFPWMAAVLVKEPIEKNSSLLVKTFHCGGSLIHPRAVLTSAYCVSGKNTQRLMIRAGEWDATTKNEAHPHQDRDVSEAIIHENFDSESLHNDVAILILSRPVELAENVDVVCLPRQYDRYDPSGCLASGWVGKAGKFQPKLKKIEFSIIPHYTCQGSLRQTRIGAYFALSPSFICADSKDDRDTCMGDGGSPLVCPLLEDPTRYVQAGIVSWGIRCGRDGDPGVYANVLAARKWIDEKMSSHNLDNASYTYFP